MQNGHPIAFISQALKGRAMSLSTYEKEMLAILLAVQKWRQYFLGRQLIIKTNQRSLKFLLDQRFQQESQHPWLIKLAGFDYQVEYKKGTENKVVDALSRRDEDEEENVGSLVKQCRTTSIVEPAWLEQVRDMISHSQYFKVLEGKSKKGELSNSRYKKISGVWFYKGRILLDPAAELCNTIFFDHHATSEGGHSGYHRTLRRIKMAFWWSGMKNFIRQAIRECEVCQRNKGETIAPPDLLNPLPLWTSFGNRFQWTLYKACLQVKEELSSWW